jgi:hypothetical protein
MKFTELKAAAKIRFAYYLTKGRKLFDDVLEFIDRWYVIPAMCLVFMTMVVLYVVHVSLVAADNLNQNIELIPKIIEIEMGKTRDVLRMEGETSRSTLKDEHSATRDQLVKDLETSEKQRQQMRLELENLKKKIDAIPTKTPRQKVLGIF